MKRYLQHLKQHKAAHISATLILIIVVSFLYSTYSPDTQASDGITFRINIAAFSECYNGIDDDNDGAVDYPEDTDCQSFYDDEKPKIDSNEVEIISGEIMKRKDIILDAKIIAPQRWIQGAMTLPSREQISPENKAKIVLWDNSVSLVMTDIDTENSFTLRSYVVSLIKSTEIVIADVYKKITT